MRIRPYCRSYGEDGCREFCEPSSSADRLSVAPWSPGMTPNIPFPGIEVDRSHSVHYHVSHEIAPKLQ